MTSYWRTRTKPQVDQTGLERACPWERWHLDGGRRAATVLPQTWPDRARRPGRAQQGRGRPARGCGALGWRASVAGLAPPLDGPCRGRPRWPGGQSRGKDRRGSGNLNAGSDGKLGRERRHRKGGAQLWHANAGGQRVPPDCGGGTWVRGAPADGRRTGGRGGGAVGSMRRPAAHGPSHPARPQAAGSERKGERGRGGEGGRWGGRGIHGGGGGGRGGPSSRGASPVDGCQPRARSPGATTQHSNRAG